LVFRRAKVSPIPETLEVFPALLVSRDSRA
jgi:hypothetical protein